MATLERSLPASIRLEDYKILHVAGKGKFSEVIKAERNGVACALKKFSQDCLQVQGLRKRVEEEIQLLQSLDHPNIVKHRGMFRGENGDVFIELEWADGGDLKQLLRRHRDRENRAHFSESRIWNFFVQIARGVHHMHENRIMHRDLKPANILVYLDLTVKVTDLGLSKKISEFTQEMHSRVGTPLYMAPEVLNNQGYSFSSDVWSMGCILYEMICLTSPFQNKPNPLGMPVDNEGEDDDDIVRLVRRVTTADYPKITEKLPYSSELRKMVDDMLKPNPADRISCSEVLERAEASNKIWAGSLSPPSAMSKTSVTAIHASMSTRTDQTRVSPPLPSPSSASYRASPRTSFSEMEVERVTVLATEMRGGRPPALSIPGEFVPNPLSVISPHSANVVTATISPNQYRLRPRRYSSGVEGGISPAGTPVPPSTRVVVVAAPGAVVSGRTGIPQSPRLSRLMATGATTQQPNSPKSAQPFSGNYNLASPRSARLPRANTSSPYRLIRKHRRAISATGDLNSPELGSSPLVGLREASGSDCSSSPATPRAPPSSCDDEEKRSQNGGARSRASLHKLSIATDKETLTKVHMADPKTAPVQPSMGSSLDFRRPRTVLLSSPSEFGATIHRQHMSLFPPTPNSATTGPGVRHQRSISNPFASLRFGSVSPEGETPVKSAFTEGPGMAKSLNPFASGDTTFTAGGSASVTPRASVLGMYEPMAIIHEDAVSKDDSRSPTTAGTPDANYHRTTVGESSFRHPARPAATAAASSSGFKFELWSKAGTKRSQSDLASQATAMEAAELAAQQPVPASRFDTAADVIPLATRQASPNNNKQSSTAAQEDDFPYLLGNKVGEGSFAKVYRAVDTTTGVSVAVKRMHIEDDDSEAASQMEKEISFLTTLNHPNLVKYIGTKRYNNRLHIILEFCTEGSITSMLQTYKRFPDSLIRLYTKQMVDALIYLHDRDIVHRDIKGGNVLVHNDGSKGIVKLSDFGCSKKLGSSSKVVEKSFKMKGTVLWMAPEAAKQSKDAGTPSDIWSLGATVIEMATGRPPWTEDGYVDEIPALIAIATTDRPPTFPVAHLSQNGIDFLRCCMQVDAKKRGSAKQLALHDFLVLEQTATVSTAEVGRKPEIVGASYNILRAAVKGRDLLMKQEQMIGTKMKEAVEEFVKYFTTLESNVAWGKIFTRDADITLPSVPVRVAGLPCIFSPGESSAEYLVSGINALEQKLGTVVKDSEALPTVGLEIHQFRTIQVRTTREMIQVESRTAMWQWEIRGVMSTHHQPEKIITIAGFMVSTFDHKGILIKNAEIKWDATGLVQKLGILSPSFQENKTNVS